MFYRPPEGLRRAHDVSREGDVQYLYHQSLMCHYICKAAAAVATTAAGRPRDFLTSTNPAPQDVCRACARTDSGGARRHTEACGGRTEARDVATRVGPERTPHVLVKMPGIQVAGAEPARRASSFHSDTRTHTPVLPCARARWLRCPREAREEKAKLCSTRTSRPASPRPCCCCRPRRSLRPPPPPPRIPPPAPIDPRPLPQPWVLERPPR